MTGRGHHCIAAAYRSTLFVFTTFLAMRPVWAWAAPGSPFGAGLSDGSIPGVTWFPRLAGFMVSLQVYFNQHITSAVRAMRHDGSALWTLLALSFVYGVVHAAGPGHGKAVVSSYVLANRQTLRNGVLLAVLASLAQAGAAIALILVATTLLHLTSVSITQATFQLEIVSDVLILLLGLWMVWNKILRPRKLANVSTYHLDMVASVPASKRTVQPICDSDADIGGHDHHSACGCGHAHIPDASIAAGSLDWRKAWTVIASTASRPCTGALIVLVFSISQKMLFAGIVATLFMGVGTAITVASLAVLAVSAHQTALLLTSADGVLGRRIAYAVEAFGAILVLLFGALLLAGNIFL